MNNAQLENVPTKSSNRFKLQYCGSIFWIIFWAILFFPVALTLLFTNSSFTFSDTTYNFQYDGSRFWLCFWVILFFPVAFLLLFLNGVSVNVQKNLDISTLKEEIK